MEDSFGQLFLGVYGPNDDQEQMDLWNKLKEEVNRAHLGAWLVISIPSL